MSEGGKEEVRERGRYDVNFLVDVGCASVC